VVDIPRRFVPPGIVSVETDDRVGVGVGVGAKVLSFTRPPALLSLHVVSSGGLTCCTSNNINSCRRVMTSPGQAMPCHAMSLQSPPRHTCLPGSPTPCAAGQGAHGHGNLAAYLPAPAPGPGGRKGQSAGRQARSDPGSFRVRTFNDSPPRSSSPVTRSPGHPAGEADCGRSRHAGFCISARCCRCVAMSVASAAVDE
jgi:hypothetical protein